MRIPRPAPATLIAIAALILAAGGFAVAAIPQADGTIHSCYKKKGGKLRVVKGTQCKDDERPLAWNQGVAGVIVRTKTLAIHTTCVDFGTAFLCSGNATDTVRCKAGERATGGGFGQATGETDSAVDESKPSPTAGKPTGWTVAANANQSGSPPPPSPEPTAEVPIYAVCAN